LPKPITIPSLESIAVRVSSEAHVPNAVSGVLFHHRLYDTFFEVLVFSIAVMGIKHLMLNERPMGHYRKFSDKPSIVLAHLGAIISALISVELAVRGHLSPGGGFAAGVAGGTAMGLWAITSSPSWLMDFKKKWHCEIVEKFSVLLFIVLAALSLSGYAWSQGPFGVLGDSGIIPVLNLLVTLKVALGSLSIFWVFIHYRGFM
jgi:multicomponent Na+:H+ antiporter subunit B